MPSPLSDEHVGGRHGGAPPDAETPPGDVHHGDRVWWRIEHDQLARETRSVAGSSGTTEAEDGRPRVDELYDGHVAVSHDDPAIARAEGRIRLELAWPEVTASSDVRHRLVSDRDAYRIEIDLVVSEDGEPRWTRRWERRFPRDHA
jgi:hypothetical protein